MMQPRRRCGLLLLAGVLAADSSFGFGLSGGDAPPIAASTVASTQPAPDVDFEGAATPSSAKELSPEARIVGLAPTVVRDESGHALLRVYRFVVIGTRGAQLSLVDEWNTVAVLPDLAASSAEVAARLVTIVTMPGDPAPVLHVVSVRVGII